MINIDANNNQSNVIRISNHAKRRPAPELASLISQRSARPSAERRPTVKTNMEPRLEKFIEYVEAEIRAKFSDEIEELDHRLELTHEGAAMVLAWFGLADLGEGVDGLIWRARGRLTSPRALRD